MRKKIVLLVVMIMVTMVLSACSVPFLNKGGDDEIADGLGGLVEGDADLVADGATPESTEPSTEQGVEGTGMLGEIADGAEGTEGTEPLEGTEPVEEEDKSNWPFNRQHPELFLFRFDGTTAYIGDIDFTGESVGNFAGNSNTNTDPDKITTIESTLLTVPLVCKNTMTEYNLTSSSSATMANYWKGDIQFSISVVDETRMSMEAEKISYPADFSEYHLRQEMASMTSEHITETRLVMMDYTLKETGVEGTGVAMLIAKTDADGYIIVRNVFNDPSVKGTDLVNLFTQNTEWKADGQ